MAPAVPTQFDEDENLDETQQEKLKKKYARGLEVIKRDDGMAFKEKCDNVFELVVEFAY